MEDGTVLPPKRGATRRGDNHYRPRKRRRLEPVVEALASLFRRRRQFELARFVIIGSSWADAVGPDVARHVQPAKLARGTLFVVVRHSAWQTELGYMAQTICETLNGYLGEKAVTGIRVWAGAPFKMAAPPPPPRPLSTKENTCVASTGDCIEDPETREAFTRLMGKWMRTEPTGRTVDDLPTSPVKSRT